MSDLYKCDCGWTGFQVSMNNVSHDSHGIAHSCPTCGNSEDDMELLSVWPGSTATLKDEMYEAVRNAERAAHAYAADCDVGEERTWAFEVFERIRLATRR